VTLHSVAVAVFAFEWVRNKVCEVADEKYSFIYLEESERWKVIYKLKNYRKLGFRFIILFVYCKDC
jgi:hypothetical protein